MMREGSTPHSSTWSISAGLAQSNPHPGVLASTPTTSQFGLHLTAAAFTWQEKEGVVDVCDNFSFENRQRHKLHTIRCEPFERPEPPSPVSPLGLWIRVIQMWRVQSYAWVTLFANKPRSIQPGIYSRPFSGTDVQDRKEGQRAIQRYMITSKQRHAVSRENTEPGLDEREAKCKPQPHIATGALPVWQKHGFGLRVGKSIPSSHRRTA